MRLRVHWAGASGPPNFISGQPVELQGTPGNYGAEIPVFTGMTEKNRRGRCGPTRWSYVRFYGRPAAEEIEVTAVLRL